MRPWVVALIGAAWMAAAGAVVFETRAFDDPAAEDLYRRLVGELRCLVCQNQSLAESDAELAGDLRTQVHELIEAGKTEAEILDYMVTRYGDFVLYRPPVKPLTLALWIAPALFALGGFWYLGRQLRAQRAAAALDEAERVRLAAWLAETDRERQA